MKRLFSITVVALLFSVMFLVGVCVAAGPVPIPTTAKWTGTLYDVGFCSLEPLLIQTVNVGKGVSSIMGESNFLFVYCVDLSTFTGSGWGIVTTAKGDRVHLTIPQIKVEFKTGLPSEWSETEVIVGGTGKFENAIGTSISHGTWTSGTASFPYGTESPPLLDPPQGWVGTTEGEIEFTQ